MPRIPTSLTAANRRFRSNGTPSSNGRGIQAAADPFRNVQRGYSFGYNNTLIEAATQTPDRSTVNYVDYDFHRVVSVQGRRTLLSLARTMYWRIPALMGAIKEQANLAVSPFNPIFEGKNDKWGELAKEWLNNFHNVMDLQRWPYSYDSWVESLITMSLVDGEIFTLLTEDGSGNPRIQTIGSHRVGSRNQTGGRAKVRYVGNQLFIDDQLVDDNLPFTFAQPVEFDAPMIDGAILDDYGGSLAYRVYDDPVVSAEYRDISARNLFPTFLPDFPGQVRGFSALASSVFDWQDVREWKRLEMLAQKGFATRGIIEENETGYVDEAKATLAAPATFDSDNKQTAPAMVKMDGGTYTVFKAGTNSKLTAFNSGDRPGRNTQDFLDQTIREAMRGTEWDAFFSLDPAHVGGAPMRVIVDRVNRTIKKRRRLAGMSCLRVDVYALSKAIRNGELPMDPEWFKWSYRGPSDVTADRRYDAQTDNMEYEKGWRNQEDIQAARNGDWRQKRNQRETEVMDLYERSKRIAEKYGISIQEAADRIELMGSANFAMQTVETDEGAKEDPQPNPTNKKEPINKPKGKKAIVFVRDNRGKVIGAREA